MTGGSLRWFASNWKFRARRALEIRNRFDRALLVQKFGGASVGGTDRIKNVARRVGGLSTNPAKFPEEVEKVVGWAPDVPAAMNAGLHQPEDYDHMGADYEAFRAYLLKSHAIS